MDASADNSSAPKFRPERQAQLPPVPVGSVPYKKPLLKELGLREGPATLVVMRSQAWQEEIGALLDEIDAKRFKPGKEKPLYTSRELESMIVYQRVCGLKTVTEARGRLAGDEPDAVEARRLLGFDEPRNKGRRRGTKGEPEERYDGVPSASTVSRHKARFAEQQDDPKARRLKSLGKRADAYERMFARLVDEHLEFPEFRDELETLNLDGSPLLTHFTCPKVNKKTGEIFNESRVTCWDGGYVPASAGPDKSGFGWNLVSISTSSSALPVLYTLPKLQESEKTEARKLARDWREQIWLRLYELNGDRHRLAVLSADAGFPSPGLRADLREISILENIHHISHGDQPRSQNRAKKADATRIPFDDPRPAYQNWYVTGNREIRCTCGRRASKRVYVESDGRVVSRMEGKCPKCGSISITSGEWRRAQNPDRYVLCPPDTGPERRDWLLGNPLTFNSELAEEYGKKRFGHGEGFHGYLSTRFGLTKHKRWFRHHAEARADVALVFSIIHALTIEQRKRASGDITTPLPQQPPQAPPLAAAA